MHPGYDRTPIMAMQEPLEPDTHGRGTADLTPVGGPVLGPFSNRSEAPASESRWLEENWLVGTVTQ
jgi:hypothetical protein